MAKTDTMLATSDTSGVLDVVGTPVRGDSWVGNHNSLVTIQMVLNKFVGRIGIQATLVPEPSDDDWFFIFLTPNEPYLVFDAPLGNGVTDTMSFNIRGNFQWFRAVIDRRNVPEVYSMSEDKWWLLGNATIMIVR